MELFLTPIFTKDRNLAYPGALKRAYRVPEWKDQNFSPLSVQPMYRDSLWVPPTHLPWLKHGQTHLTGDYCESCHESDKKFDFGKEGKKEKETFLNIFFGFWLLRLVLKKTQNIEPFKRCW